MSRVRCLVAGAVFCFWGAFAWGQEAPPNEEVFCEGQDNCVDDTMEVIFVANGSSIFEYETFEAGTRLDIELVFDTKSEKVQGWSYSVAHDDQFLTLIADSVTSDGTIVDPDHPDSVAIPPNFDVTNAVPGGWIQAVVLSFLQPTELPLGRNAVAKASYTLDNDAGTDGTLIRIASGEIGAEGSPPTTINLTVNGLAKLPSKLVHGLVRKGGAPAEVCDDGQDNDGDGDVDCDDSDCAGDPACPVEMEVCDDGQDNDGDGQVDCDDSDCAGDPACPAPECPDWAFYFGPEATSATFEAGDQDIPVGMRNATPAFAFQLGVKYTAEGEVTRLEFSGELGADATRIVELIITDNEGNSQTPVAGNAATSTRDLTEVGVRRGSAIEAFADGDFFAVDQEPGVGGPGFIVGYVSDLDGDTNVIPMTPADGCPLNEILVIGGVVPPEKKFQRGDANGDSKINVTDAVLIIQIVLGNLPARFDCEDALDANDDGQANITDALPVLAWIFQRGDRLPEPFLACGTDPTADDLSCNEDSPNCR